jgi:hypothetical protein
MLCCSLADIESNRMQCCDTANHFVNVLSKMFESSLISSGLWPARSPDLNPGDFYLWGNQKNNVYFNNLNMSNKLKHNDCETVTYFEVIGSI